MRYIGPQTPLKRTPEHGAYHCNTTYKEELKQNLRNLVLTSPGGRIMHPGYGVGLRRMLFEFDTDETARRIRTTIENQVAEYLPIIEIVDILVERNDRNLPNTNYGINKIRVKIKINTMAARDPSRDLLANSFNCPSTRLENQLSVASVSFNSQSLVRFCQFASQLLQHFPSCVLYQHTCELRQSVPMDRFYLLPVLAFPPQSAL